MKIAVVTGASSGIGREFAVQLAAAGGGLEELWLIARREDRLQELASSLPLPARVLSYDLTDPASFDAYAALLEREKPQVFRLVNAAGYGRFALGEDIPLDVQMNMIDLNCKALVTMCHTTLPYMRRGGAIFNMGSVSAFQPVPYINLYGSTKIFVTHYSRALNVELEPKGIKVMAVSPMWIKTEFVDEAAVDSSAVTYYNRFRSPRSVVALALRDLERSGTDLSILGLGPKLQVAATKLVPHRLVMKIWMKQQKHDNRPPED